MMSLIFQLCVDECTQLIKEVEQIVYTAVTTRLSNFPQKNNVSVREYILTIFFIENAHEYFKFS